MFLPSNSSLQHLAEKVLWNLEMEDLKICAQINQFCKQILKNPIFCLSKFEHLSKNNKQDWIKAIQSVENSDKGIAIISYLKWNNFCTNPPCYSSLTVQDDFRKKIWKCCEKSQWELREESSDENTKIVKILAPLTDNPNDPDDEYGSTPFYWAAVNGHTEIVKILGPLHRKS